jgi:hypothetical protein
VKLGSSYSELGKHVERAEKLLKELGWQRTCDTLRSRCDIHEDVKLLPHPAAPLLERIRRNGVPVVLASEPWSDELKAERFLRGPHKSAEEFLEFLREEYVDFCEKGFWMLLPYDSVKNFESLRLSPLGVVPQRERRPRVIVDYSFHDVNIDTVKLSPAEAMQFGKANERLQSHLVKSNPKYGDCHMYKVDISDGFYRVPLSTSGVPKLGVCLPKFPGLPELVAFPLVLPMGWTESPPFFCCFTETACDLANEELRHNKRSPSHPLEEKAGAADHKPNPDRGHDEGAKRATPLSHQPGLKKRPMAYVDVFVDDFCGVGQDHPMNPLKNQRNVLMHKIDKVFRPTDDRDKDSRKEPISESKLDKQDAAWQDMKRCLGWDYGAKSKSLVVASHRREKAQATLEEALSQNRVSLTKWQSLIGQLRSLTDGLPGSEGQFSLLQHALTKQAQGRVRIDDPVRQQLHTFQDLLNEENRPTQLEELVAGDPVHIGACDAAKSGMGGVWFPASGPPLLWREPFDGNIQDRVVSQVNRRGDITNSDLELAGTIGHHAVLADNAAVAGETTHTLCDNTPSVAWREKGSTTTTKRTAYLLRLAALHRKEQICNPKISHISGDDNRMADDASRRWDLNDEELLTYFNSTYPQARSWQLCPLRKQVSSETTSMLCQPKSKMESVLRGLSKQTTPGKSGPSSVNPLTPTPALAPTKTQSQSYTCLPGDGAMAESHPLGTRSALELRRTPYVKWARRFPYWGPTIHASRD